MDLEALRLLDISSFLNIWYWLIFSLAWSRATYWTLGVGFHDARLAATRQGRYMTEFETLITINVSRHTEIFDQLGWILLGLVGFFLATMGTLGFGFRYEIMQASFLLLAPLTLATLFSIRFAYRLRKTPLSGMVLYRAICIHRRIKQIFGALTMMFVALWSVFRLIVDNIDAI